MKRLRTCLAMLLCLTLVAGILPFTSVAEDVVSGEKLEDQVRHMKHCLRTACEKYGAQLELKWINSYSGYWHDEEDEFVQHVFSAIRAAGQEPKLISSGGGSDANILCANGIRALLTSTGMKKVHTCREEVEVSALERTTKVALCLLTN